VILRCTGDSVHAHTDQSAGENVACESRRPAARDFLGEWNNLRLIPIFVDGDGNVGIAFRLHHTGGNAGSWNFESGYFGRRSCRRGRNGNIFGRPSHHGRAANTRQRDAAKSNLIIGLFP
jgi:hypothetical protein